MDVVYDRGERPMACISHSNRRTTTRQITDTINAYASQNISQLKTDFSKDGFSNKIPSSSVFGIKGKVANVSCCGTKRDEIGHRRTGKNELDPINLVSCSLKQMPGFMVPVWCMECFPVLH